MKLTQLTMRHFRCFGEEGGHVALDALTCFVGPNGSGKTTALVALARLFGELRQQRQVVPGDFHLEAGEALDAKESRTLTIECRLEFPELLDPDADLVGVPESFNHMIVAAPGSAPYCRLRLEAKWTRDGTVSGDIEQVLEWITTDSDAQADIDANRRRVNPIDRSKIRLVYVPAARDPESQIRSTAASGVGRLLEALSWDGAEVTLKEKLSEVQEEVAHLTGIKTLNASVQEAWNSLYAGAVARDVEFRAVEQDPAQLVKALVASFKPSEDGASISTSDLSDGLRSLFSLSISLALHDVEAKMRASPGETGFLPESAEEIPRLTILAVEEPENHLSPHYLGKITAALIAPCKYLDLGQTTCNYPPIGVVVDGQSTFG